MSGQPESRFGIVQRLVFSLGLAALVSGCISKSKADAQARLAYLAGQRDAMMQMQRQGHRGPVVAFIGPVNNPVVPWQEGMTLSQAIVKAVYNLPTDPTGIVIHRNGQDIQVNPGQLLSGQDVPLQPGDVIEINQAISTTNQHP
jgi:hypothetical protein